MEEEKEYFVWEPYKKSKDAFYNNSVSGIKVVYFDINLSNEDLDKINLRKDNVNGLARIVKKTDSSSKIYNIQFKGHIKEIISMSEEDKRRFEKRRESSRDCMRRLREKRSKNDL